MRILLILFLLASCAPPSPNVNHGNTGLNFNDNLSFDDFNNLLIEYAKTSPFPNINNRL